MPGTGIKRFGTKTCFVAPNREVFTTYPGGWPGGYVHELTIVVVEVEAEKTIALAVEKSFGGSLERVMTSGLPVNDNSEFPGLIDQS